MGGKRPIFFSSTGLRSEYGGPAFSEALLCAEIAKKEELIVASHFERIDLKFCEKFGLKNVVSYGFRDLFTAPFDSEHFLSSFIRRSKLVHLNGHWTFENIVLSHLCRKYKTPYIFHPRGMLWVGHRKIFLKKLYNFLVGNRIIRKAASVIALSEFETLTWTPYKIQADRIKVIPNPIVKEEIPQHVEKNPQNYFLYLGRIEKRKNLPFLLKSYAEYRRQGGKFPLYFVGPGERGEPEKLIEEIKRLELQHDVKFKGPAYHEDKFNWVLGAKAVIYPAVQEAFGRVPFETLGLGVPCLVPVESGGYEYLKKDFEEFGYEEDQDRLAEKLMFFEKNEFDKSNQVQEFVETHFNPKLIAESMGTIYHEVQRKN